MSNIKKINYLDIKNLLVSKNIHPISSLKDNVIFSSLNSLSKADENELTFFNDTSQLLELSKTKAKACLINNLYAKHLPSSTSSIVIENTYNAFAVLSNLFAPKILSNGIISQYSSISKNTSIKNNVQIDQFVHI